MPWGTPPHYSMTILRLRLTPNRAEWKEYHRKLQYYAFGRLSKDPAPGDTASNPGAAYTYYDTASPLRIDVQQNGYSTSTYYSGLGQVLQESRSNLGHQKIIVSNYAYNAQGQQSAVYVPYQQAYTSSYLPPSAGADHAPKSTTRWGVWSRIGSPMARPNLTPTTACRGIHDVGEHRRSTRATRGGA